MGKYQPFNDLPAAQFQALVDDIAKRGVLLPILVDENDKTIDGHQRRRAAAEAGVECPKVVVEGLTEDEKQTLALTLNLFRRHLAGVERTKALQQLANLGMSTRRMADVLGLSKSTVHRDLSELSQTGQLERPERVEGADGKSRPATMPERPRVQPEHVNGADGRNYSPTRDDEDVPPADENGEALSENHGSLEAPIGSDQSEGVPTGTTDTPTGAADAAGLGDDEQDEASAPSPAPKVAPPEATPAETRMVALEAALNAALKLTTQWPDHEQNLGDMSQTSETRAIYLGGVRSLGRWVNEALVAADESPRLKAVQ